MCGIAGLVGRLPAEVPDPLGAALRALARRGPDGQGRVEGRLGADPVRLGVRRLDLVEPGGASQPVRHASGGLLVLNGEVYNHGRLREELRAEGEAFESEGDAEVLLALLERWGPDGLARVEGSYAFAWLGGAEGALVLGRDPLGVRPLAVALLPEGLVFGSTLDAILATGLVRRDPDGDAIADVLRDGVVSTCRTAIRGVRRIAPGELLHVGPGLTLASRRVLPAPPAPAPEGGVLEALRVAVCDRLETSRPTAVFLSGGVDSALLAALTRDVRPVPALTVTFPAHGAVDEARRAQRTARRLGLVHVDVPCPRDPTPWVLGTADAFDEPFADASAVPTWGLGLAAGRHAAVALTGTGGDELFGGYRRYWLLGAGPWLRHVPAFMREPVSLVLERTLPSGARLLRASGDPQGFYRGLLRLQSLAELRALVGPRLATLVDLPLITPALAALTPQAAMAEDFVRYLPDDLLVKEDRALMAHGVEGRHPFLDRRVRAAAHRIEVRGGPGRSRQKVVLRAFVHEFVDPDLARAPKRGFAFPVDDLYRGPLRPLAEELLLTRPLRERGFIASSGAARLLREHVRGGRNLGQVVHAVVMLELWARRVLDQAPVRA